MKRILSSLVISALAPTLAPLTALTVLLAVGAPAHASVASVPNQPDRTPTRIVLYVPSPPTDVTLAPYQRVNVATVDYWPLVDDRTIAAYFVASGPQSIVRLSADGGTTVQLDTDLSGRERAYALIMTYRPTMGMLSHVVLMAARPGGDKAGSGLVPGASGGDFHLRSVNIFVEK